MLGGWITFRYKILTKWLELGLWIKLRPLFTSIYVLNNSDCYQVIFILNLISLQCIVLAVLLNLLSGGNIHGSVFKMIKILI